MGLKCWAQRSALLHTNSGWSIWHAMRRRGGKSFRSIPRLPLERSANRPEPACNYWRFGSVVGSFHEDTSLSSGRQDPLWRKRMIAVESPAKQTRTTKKRFELRTPVSVFLVVLPVILFYGNLLRTALDLPFYDDYRAVILFVNRLSQTHGLAARASYFFAAQHNEYKLFFEHAIVCLQYWALGHVNFLFLSAAGN